jgi:hypothetical protein
MESSHSARTGESVLRYSFSPHCACAVEDAMKPCVGCVGSSLSEQARNPAMTTIRPNTSNLFIGKPSLFAAENEE